MRRLWPSVAAVLWALACEEKREPAALGATIASAQSKLTLGDLAEHWDPPPISESSYWSPWLSNGFTTNSGTQFSNRDAGALDSVWIRICWSRSAQYSRMIDGRRLPLEPGATQAIRWVREAVGATWMHYANIDFFHWDRMARWIYCTDEREPNRIVVGFSDINFADHGRSDSAPTRILFDGNMTTREQYMRAAYNLFGRALGVLPTATDASTSPTPAGIYAAQVAYGLRPSGTLIEQGGQCVRDSIASNSNDRGTIDRIDCRLYNDRIWRPMRLADDEPTLLGTYLSSGDARCIQGFPDGEKPVPTGHCDSAKPVDFSAVKWKATGNLCVAASSASENASLQLQACEAAITLSRWNFEFHDPTSIQLAGAQTCLAVTPVEAVEGAGLTLRACDQVTTQLAFTAEALLRFAEGLYAAVEDDRFQPAAGKKLLLRTGDHLGPVSRFYVSGRITSGGRCATAPATPFLGDVDWCVESRDCSACPTPTMDVESDPFEWDYHW